MRFLTVIAVTCLLPSHAHAQFAMSASDGFQAGLMLPWLFAEQMIALIATGLFLGQQRSLAFFKIWPAFLLAMGIGLTIPPTIFSLLSLGLTLLSIAIVMGGLTALKLPIPMLAAIAVAAAAGVVEGVASAPGASDWGAALGVAAGSALRANLFFTIPFLVADWFGRSERRPWASIALRVAGSWVAAISIMMLALVLVPVS